MKHLKYRNIFLNNNYPINEALVNEIPWGDSLLGRLISSSIRKSTIGYNLVKMESVISRIQDQFNILMAESVISSASDDIKFQIEKIKISALVGSLKKSIDNGEKINIIKNILNDTILNIKSFNPSNDQSELFKSEYLRKLEDLKSIIDQESDVDVSENDSIQAKMTDNLQNLIKIFDLSKGLSFEKKSENSIKKGNYYLYEKDGKSSIIRISSINNDIIFANYFNIDSNKWISIDKVIDSKFISSEINILDDHLDKSVTNKVSKLNIPVFVKSTSTKGDNLKKLESVSESTSSVENSKIQLNDLISSINSLKLTLRTEEITKMISNKEYELMTNLYKEIYKLEKGISDGVNESISVDDMKRDKSTLVKIAKSFSSFSKISSKFENDDMYKKMGDIGNEIHLFNTSLSEILNSKHILINEKLKSESVVLTYNNFVKLNESDDGEILDKDTISSKFYKIFKKDDWNLSKDDVYKLENQLSKIEKNSKKITINGIDPIMEIVKIFNRAYKLHTTPVIPSGRSGGKVSNKTFREYTYMGEGGPGSPQSPSTGAWRNNALYDKWENAVLDIVKDSKYRPIFNEGTTIKVGEGDEKKNAGKILLKFINDMLDDNKLYKAGSQKQFIEKYFGVQNIDEKNLGIKSDMEINNKTSSSIKEKTYSFNEVSEIPDGKIFKSTEEISRGFFSFLLEKDNGEKERKYIWIHKVTENAVYFKYSNTFYSFIKYVKQVSSGAKVDKGKMPALNDKEKNEEGKLYAVHYARCPIKEFPIKIGKKLNISSYNITLSNKLNRPEDKKEVDPEKEEIGMGQVRSIFVLVNEDGEAFNISNEISIKKGGQSDGIDHTFYINKLIP